MLIVAAEPSLYKLWMGFFSELKRRNVFRMAALYLVSAWLVMQVAEVVIGLANLPDWIGPLTLVMLGVGLPIALILSWFYELTPEGITLDQDAVEAAAIREARGRRVDFVVIAVLCAAVVMFAYDKWWPEEVLEQSIAVLAFENMSGDPEQEYLSDGIAEELLNALAKIPELHVTSRSSSFSFKNQNVPISEVAQQLNVSHVLEGSVRKSGERIRITAQLIDAASDKHLWSETYDRELTDLFTVQDDIAGQIREALKVRLVESSGEDASPAVTRSAELVAYDAYLQGREILRHRDHRRYEEAGNLFLRAVRLDPTFAEAHAQVAITAGLAYERLSAEEMEYVANFAIEHLAKAEALNPDFPELHGARGLFAVNTDPAEAVVHLERALELNPNYADAMNWLHNAYARVGRDEEAEQILQRMFAIDPLSVLSLARQFNRMAASGQYAEAHALAEKMSVYSKARAYWYHTRASLHFQGNVAEGLYWGLKMGEELGDNYSLVWIPLILAGEYDEARRLTDEAEPYIAALEGRFDDAIGLIASQAELALVDPAIAVELAGWYYHARRFAEALPLYERFFASGRDGNLPYSPESGQLLEQVPVIRLMRLADTRRRLGDESGAHEAAEVARQENAKLRSAGRSYHNRDIAEAMLAAFDGDRVAAFTALRAAIRNGMRLPFQDQPIFDELRDDPEMVKLSEELNSVNRQEHAKVLQLICFENPTPNAWRPLPETCEGVTDRPGLLEFRQ